MQKIETDTDWTIEHKLDPGDYYIQRQGRGKAYLYRGSEPPSEVEAAHLLKEDEEIHPLHINDGDYGYLYGDGVVVIVYETDEHIFQYSTSEQDAKKRWIDGRTVYVKTLSIPASNTGYNSIPHGITDLDFIITNNGYTVQQDGGVNILPRIGTALATESIHLDYFTATHLYGYVGLNYVGDSAIVGGAITIEYVKTE
jgi:hypothetical protein